MMYTATDLFIEAHDCLIERFNDAWILLQRAERLYDQTFDNDERNLKAFRLCSSFYNRMHAYADAAYQLKQIYVKHVGAEGPNCRP